MIISKVILITTFLCVFSVVEAQVRDENTLVEDDTLTNTLFYIINGDTIAREVIALDEVVLLKKVAFNSKENRRRYLILRRKTRKVYPYAKLAAERLTSMQERLSTLKKKSDKRIYTKRVQKYVEEEFSDQLKKLTRTEGQILVKLIYRQTGITTFDLIKTLRTGWRAFWYNTTASMFDISLKEKYDPYNIKEDYLIEDILERSFQAKILVRQEPASPIDFNDLKAHWGNMPVDK